MFLHYQQPAHTNLKFTKCYIVMNTVANGPNNVMLLFASYFRSNAFNEIFVVLHESVDKLFLFKEC